MLKLISFTHKNALPADITSPNLGLLEIIQFKARRYYFQLQGLAGFIGANISVLDRKTILSIADQFLGHLLMPSVLLYYFVGLI